MRDSEGDDEGRMRVAVQRLNEPSTVTHTLGLSVMIGVESEAPVIVSV